MTPDNVSENLLRGDTRKPYDSLLDEGEYMTLCIAADCWINDKPALAYCCDTRAERGGIFHELVGSEDAWKIREIGKNIALVSGIETSADRLLAVCDKTIQEFGEAKAGDDSDILIDRLLRDLEGHAVTRKKAIIDHWLGFDYGISHSEFLRTHKEGLDAEQGRDIWKRIHATDLDTDLLICGFQDEEPVIVKFDRFGKAHWETNYSVVGSGADIALSFLCQHDWDDSPTLIQCAYYLLEAKTAAERNRHVGEFTRLHFMMSDGKRFQLKERVYDRLDRQVENRRKVKTSPFSMDMLEELTGDPPPNTTL
jgi:hypothetical protein